MSMKGCFLPMKTALRMFMMALAAFTLFSAAAATQAAGQTSNTSTLQPPKGSKIAILVFEDLECPQCARIEPMLEQAVNNYKVPLVRYDFPIPGHPWSLEAHVAGRFFDAKSKAMGEEFRRYIFANQGNITKLNLRSMIERFAAEHHVALPMFLDPTGELNAKVKEDFAYGEKVGIDHTPTVYVVSASPRASVIEVKDVTQLFSVLDQVKSQLAESSAPASKPAKSATRKTATP
jgi:protein-disulfide isomerase